ncbi:MAG: serine/threonine protein kinase [Lentisphaeria bacterium]|nr:serine/threonine protein kinase [Lentisphaeria bacterium]
MRFACPKCRGIIEVDDSERGNPVGCAHCNKFVVVPEEKVSTNVVINTDFILQGKLGQGGVGTVYEAHQISLDRSVALKILMSQFAQDKTFVEDFIREARSAARLNHPNIVQAFAVGQDDGVFFCAMELVRGETLKDVIEREGHISIPASFKIMRQMSEAINFAWQTSQLVHRDIKPDNIMITEKDVAKLADLGLARVASESEVEGDEIMGTPQYISPEQLLGLKTDVRTDIYSLGATWYHAITGEFPYMADTPQEIAQMHLEATLVPPITLNPDIPKVLSVMICKMMAKHPEDRYADAEELIKDIKLAEKKGGKKGKGGKRGPSMTISKTQTSRINMSTRTGNLKMRTGTRSMATSTGSFLKKTGTATLTKKLNIGKQTHTVKLGGTAKAPSKTIVLGKAELDGGFEADSKKKGLPIIPIVAGVVILLLVLLVTLLDSKDDKRLNAKVAKGLKETTAVKVIAFEDEMRSQKYSSSKYKNVLSAYSKIQHLISDRQNALDRDVYILVEASCEKEIRSLRKKIAVRN